MPIVFEQPSPVGQFPSAYYGYGQVEQGNLDRDYALRQNALTASVQAGNANRDAAQQQAQQHLAMQSGIAGAEMQQQTNLAGYHGQLQQAMLDQQGQQQAALQQQHAQLQMAQFTQADAMQLAKLQQADSFIDQQSSQGNWSPDETAEAKAHVRGVMGPLMMKQQAAKTQALQQAAQEEQQKAALQSAYMKTNLGLLSQGKPPVMEDDDGEKYIMHPDGKLQHVKVAQEKDAQGEQDFKEYQHVVSTFNDLTKHFHSLIKTTGATGETKGIYADQDEADQARAAAMIQATGAENPNVWRQQHRRGQAQSGAIQPSQPPPSAAPAAPPPPMPELPPTPTKTVLPGGPAIPAGYRTDPKVPGYILPSHWREGEHYRVIKDENGEPKPQGLLGENRPGLNPAIIRTAQKIKDWLGTPIFGRD